MNETKEQLEIYSLEGEFLRLQMREDYYREIREEFKQTGRVSTKVKSIRMLLLTSNGRIYIQKRSYRREENSGLYDKTIGGHVKAGYPWELTVVQECHEELGVPVVILPEDQIQLALQATDLGIIGLLRKIETIDRFVSVRKSASADFLQPFITSFYIGYYDGAIRFCDGESTGIEVLTLEEFDERIEESPDQFTEDLKFIVKRYKNFIVPVSFQAEEVLGFESIGDQPKAKRAASENTKVIKLSSQ